MAHNVAPVAPNRASMAHNIAPVAHTITLVAPPLYYSLYIQSPPPRAVRRGSKVGIPRGRCENHVFFQSLLLWFWNLTFSFRCVLR